MIGSEHRVEISEAEIPDEGEELREELTLRGKTPVRTGQREKTILDVSTGLSVLNTPKSFQGGQLKWFIPEWEKITTDKWILETLKGYNLERESTPWQSFTPKASNSVMLNRNKLTEKSVNF